MIDSLKQIAEHNLTTLASSKATAIASGAWSFGFLVADDRVFPIMIVGFLISIIIFIFDFFHEEMEVKPYGKLITKIIKNVILGTLIMNVSFFGLIYFFPDMSMILVASVAGGLTSKSNKILTRIDTLISEFNPLKRG